MTLTSTTSWDSSDKNFRVTVVFMKAVIHPVGDPVPHKHSDTKKKTKLYCTVILCMQGRAELEVPSQQCGYSVVNRTEEKT